jgi:hypothetical protein
MNALQEEFEEINNDLTRLKTFFMVWGQKLGTQLEDLNEKLYQI